MFGNENAISYAMEDKARFFRGRRSEELTKPTITKNQAQTIPLIPVTRNEYANCLENTTKNESQLLPDNQKTNQGSFFTEYNN